jgi:hypothetical protein
MMVVSVDPVEAERGIAILRVFRPVINLDQLVSAYTKEADADKRARLAFAYRVVTGEAIEHRLAILQD